MSERPGENCLCYRQHADDCPYFDFTQGYWNLKSDIEALQKILSKGFSGTLGYNGQVYYIGLKHPTQDEEFTGDTLLDALREFDAWDTECAAME